MSLYLANISPKIRKDELERVFRRYGNCSVRLKSRFGFVDYDFVEDAEKALSSLSGWKICGESIHLSWSNRAKPQQRSVGTTNDRDLQYRRGSDIHINNVRQNYSRSHEDYPARDKPPDDGGGRRMYVNGRDERGGFNHKKTGHALYNQREERLEEGDRVELNQADHGRWGEGSDGRQDAYDFNGQTGFDRYEPGQGDKRGVEYDAHCSAASPIGEQSLDKNRRGHHHDNMRGRQTCYTCGAVGHKKRECPTNLKPHNKSNTKARGDKVGGVESRSVGRYERRRGTKSGKRHEADGISSHVEKAGRNASSSHRLNGSKLNSGIDCNTKRLRDREDENVKAHSNKKLRTQASPLDYVRTSPERGAHSGSIKPLPGFSPRSRSRSPMTRSHSTSSVSKSRSNHSRYVSSKTKSRSRSRSRSPSSSRSISLGRPLSFSSDNAEQYVKGSIDCVSSPQAKEATPEIGDEVEPKVGKEDFSVLNRLETRSSASSESEDNLVERHRLAPEPKDENPVSTNNQEVSLDGCLEGGHIPPSDGVLEKSQLRGPKSTADLECEYAEVPVISEDASFPHRVRGDVELKQGDRNTSVGEFGAEKLQENKDLENAHSVGMMNYVEPANQSSLEILPNLHVGSHLSISMEELRTALSHYGLKNSEENEQDLGLEDYFGAACLWPWEIIYYRRLKKGAITVENYERRVAQNKAFCITDKYIRSSTGWGESIEENV